MFKSPNRLVALILGAFYVLVGLLGFTVTAGVGFFSTEGGELFGIFQVNMFHNIAHLAIGVALFIASLVGVPAAKTTNTIVGAVYLLLGIVGLFIVGSELNILALNAEDHVLHFASAAVLLGVALGTDKARVGIA